MWPNPQETADSLAFTGEILNGKLHFLCSGSFILFNNQVTESLILDALIVNQTPFWYHIGFKRNNQKCTFHYPVMSMMTWNFENYGFHPKHENIIILKFEIEEAFIYNEFIFFFEKKLMFNFQKQPSRGVIKKRCSENIQQIYMITPMPKCDFNKVAKKGYLMAKNTFVEDITYNFGIGFLTTSRYKYISHLKKERTLTL